jgi:hypothetical protein
MLGVMTKQKVEDTDVERTGFFLYLDPQTKKRAQKQAARSYGTVQGYLQDYARGALIMRLEKDEATMPPSKESDPE